MSAYVTRGVVIDTGFPAVGVAFAQFLRTHRPSAVIVTHAHEDHAGNIDHVLSAGIPLAIATSTVSALRESEIPRLYRRFTWGTPRPVPDELVQGEVSGGFELLATPGHSPDHHIVWDAERATVFGADLFLGVKARLAQPELDPYTLVRSLRAVVALQPKRFFCAHRGLLPDPVGMLTAKANWIEDTVGAIERGISEGKGEKAVTRDVLGPEPIVRYASRGDMSHANFVNAVLLRGPGPRRTPAM